MKVFISWSGEVSRDVAIALRQWLPDVIQSVQPWMSVTDIDAGARWGTNVANELSESSFGILCLTRESMTAPWLLFEAGALAKSIAQGRVCPYLIGLEPSDVLPGPLIQFQSKRANKTETFDLVSAINSAQSDRLLATSGLERAFELWWPRLEDSLNTALTKSRSPDRKRPTDDVLSEVLAEVRSISRRFPPTSDSPMPDDKRFEIIRIEKIRSAVFSHPSLRERRIVKAGATWGANEVGVDGLSPRGIVVAKVKVPSWEALDDDRTLTAVIDPLISQLIEQYDGKRAIESPPA